MGVELIEQVHNTAVHQIYKGLRPESDPEYKEKERGKRHNLADIQVREPGLIRIGCPAPDDFLQHPEHVGGSQDRSGDGCQSKGYVVLEEQVGLECADQDQKFADKAVGPWKAEG